MNETKTQFTSSDLGLIIDGSADSADYINEETIAFAESYGFKGMLEYDELGMQDDEDRGQILSEIADDAVSFLNDCDLPPYCAFYFEDNSLFFTPSVESAQEDVGFVTSEDQDYPADDYEGKWLHVSGHGNATLYVRSQGRDKEIWGVV